MEFKSEFIEEVVISRDGTKALQLVRMDTPKEFDGAGRSYTLAFETRLLGEERGPRIAVSFPFA